MLLCALPLVDACDGDPTGSADGGGELPAGCDLLIEPGNTREGIQSELDERSAYDTVCVAVGKTDFDGAITISVDNITLRGMSSDSAILDFGANGGLVISGSDVTVEKIAVHNAETDGITMDGAIDTKVRDVTVAWPGLRPGSAGIVARESTRVRVERARITGAQSTGIRFAATRESIATDNHVQGARIGIEVLSGYRVEARGNQLDDNAIGIAVMDLPDRPSLGGATLIVDNDITSNNNGASSGVTVSTILPSGIGVAIVASDSIDIASNRISGNESTGIFIVSYGFMETQGAETSAAPNFDPFPEQIWIHGNRFTDNGSSPTQMLSRLLAPVEAILWDGYTDASKDNSDRSLSLCLGDNVEGSFLNFDGAGDFAMPSTETTAHECEHEGLAPL